MFFFNSSRYRKQIALLGFELFKSKCISFKNSKNILLIFAGNNRFGNCGIDPNYIDIITSPKEVTISIPIRVWQQKFNFFFENFYWPFQPLSFIFQGKTIAKIFAGSSFSVVLDTGFILLFSLSIYAVL